MPRYDYSEGAGDADQAGLEEAYQAGIDEAMGNAPDDNNVLGAIFRGRPPARRPQRPGFRAPSGRQIFGRPPLPKTPFQPNLARLRAPLGFGSCSWQDTDGSDKVLPVTVQESFRGERPVITENVIVLTGSPPAPALGIAAGLTVVRRIEVGTMPQTPSTAQPIPVEMFAPNTTDAYMEMQIAYRATTIQVVLGRTSAPGTGVTVTCTVGIYGQWIR